MSTRDRQRGFTLIEILVALALLLIGMTSIAGLFAVGLDQLRRSRLRSETGAVVPLLMEDVEERLLDQVSMLMNAQLASSAARDPEAELPEILEQKEPLPVPGVSDLQYSYRGVKVPGRLLDYLTEIEMHWKIRGKQSSRQLKTVFELRESLVRQKLQKSLEYKVPVERQDG